MPGQLINKNNCYTIRAVAGTDEAELLLYGDIGDDYWSDNNAADFAYALNSLKVSNIKVRINSPGGSVWAAQAMFSSLKNHPANVTVYIDGVAASAATLVAMAGDTIIMPTNAVMMIHNPMISAYGANRNELEQMIKLLDTARETMIAVYEAHSGQTREKIIELLDAETWLTAAEAKALGFVDEVQDFKIAASISGDKLILGGWQFDRAALAKMGFPESVVGPITTAAPQPEHKDQKDAAPAAKIEGRDNLMTLEQLKAEHPDIFAAIASAARDEGMQAERDRLMAIDNVAMPGYEEMVADAKKNGVSAEALAMKIIAAEKDKAKVAGVAAAEDGKDLASALKDIKSEAPDADAAKLADLTGAFVQGASQRRPAGK